MPVSTHYIFHRCLGRGGFGEVYLATQRSASGLERRVAVKVLRDGLSNQSTAVKRFRDEGRMLAMLDHPAILGVHELTRIRGHVSLVTEYIEGTDLSRCCRTGALMPARVALTVVGEVASALHTAWTTKSPETGKPLRLVHRDIKPENIRLSRHGEIKLLDFGIARSNEMAREARTALGDIPFTPGYAAPESFITGDQGSPTDVFALGATLYRVLVGQRFYRGVKLSDQVAISAGRARYIHYLAERMLKVDSTLDDDLVPLLREMLAWAPESRPTADQLQNRAEAMADRLDGPTPKRWARSADFPDAPSVEGAALTGLALDEDDVSQIIDSRVASEITTQQLYNPRARSTPRPPQPPRGLDSLRPDRAPPDLDPIPPTPTPEQPAARSTPVAIHVARMMLGLGMGMLFIGIIAAAAVALGMWAGS